MLQIYNHHLFLLNICIENHHFNMFWLNDNSENLINFTFHFIILLYKLINPKNYKHI